MAEILGAPKHSPSFFALGCLQKLESTRLVLSQLRFMFLSTPMLPGLLGGTGLQSRTCFLVSDGVSIETIATFGSDAMRDLLHRRGNHIEVAALSAGRAIWRRRLYGMSPAHSQHPNSVGTQPDDAKALGLNESSMVHFWRPVGGILSPYSV